MSSDLTTTLSNAPAQDIDDVPDGKDESQGGRFLAMERIAILSAPDATVDNADAAVGVLEPGTTFEADGSQTVASDGGGLERLMLRINLEKNGLPDIRSFTYGWVSEVSANGLSVVCVDLGQCHQNAGQRLVGKSNVYFDGYYKCEHETTLYEELTTNQQRVVGPQAGMQMGKFFALRGKTGQTLPPGAIVKATQHVPRAPCSIRTPGVADRYRSYVRTPGGWILVAKSRSTFSWASHSDWSATPVSCNELVLRAGGGAKISADNWLGQFRQTPLGARIEFVWHAALWLQTIGLASFGFWQTHVNVDSSCTIWANEEQLDNDGNPCDPSTGQVMLMLFGVEVGLTILWHMVHQKCCNPCGCFEEYWVDFSKSGTQAVGVVGELAGQPDRNEKVRLEHFLDVLLPCKWPWEMLTAVPSLSSK